MRLRTSYTLKFLSKLPLGFEIPFCIEMGKKIFEITEIDESGDRASAFVEGSVNPEHLQVRVGPQRFNGSEPNRGIEIPERAVFSSFLSRIVNILSFLTDIPIRYSHKLGGDLLIVETAEDSKLLEDFGTEEIFQSTSVAINVRSFSLPQVSYKALELLAKKEVGLALYAQAMLIQEPVAIFREFWKVLESAFGTKDDDLIRSLTNFKPAKQLGFTQDELKKLLVLRGRASHAKSRSGIKEHQYVVSETSRAMPRLKCLVEQVILTKKTWGRPTSGTERIAKLAAFIDSDGKLVLIKHAESSGDE